MGGQRWITIFVVAFVPIIVSCQRAVEIPIGFVIGMSLQKETDLGIESFLK